MFRHLALILVSTLLLCRAASAAIDWSGQTLTGIQSYTSGETITCSGTLTIEGSLTLSNGSTLVMAAPIDGAILLKVVSGGSLRLFANSKITALDPTKRYRITFEPGSQGTIDASTIEYTYSAGPAEPGFVVKTPNLTISNSLIQNSNSHGLVVGASGQPADNFRLVNSTVKNNELSGILIEDGSQNYLVSHSTIEGNLQGIVVASSSSGEIASNIISQNLADGIIITGESFAYLHDNTVAGNTTNNIVIDNSRPVISTNSITSAEVGIKIVNNASPNLENGGNVFSGQTSKIIQNETTNTLNLSNNNWGTDDQTIIQNKIDGRVNLGTIIDTYPPTLSSLTLQDQGTITGETTRAITWTSFDGGGLPTEAVSLYYSLNSGTNYTLIASTENTGSYNWIVPDIYTNSGKIKIEVRDRSNNISTQESQSIFTILLARQIITPETGVQLNLPSGSTPQPVNITVTTLESANYPPPSGKVLASDIFNFQSNVANFSSPISITLPIKHRFLGYSPYYWDGSNWLSDSLTVTAQSADSLTFTTTHLSIFALFSASVSSTAPLAAPNPFNPLTETTKLIYYLPAAGQTSIYLFNVTGHRVWTRVFSPADPEGGHAGINQVTWDGRNQFSEVAENGVYLLKIMSDNKLIGSSKVIVFR